MSQNYGKSQSQLRKQENRLVAAHVTTSGPLPSSQELERYEACVPGMANRIMIMAEKDQDSHLERLSKAQSHDISQKYLGMFFAFLIVMAFCGLTYIAIQNDMEWVASIITLSGLATLISKFIK